MSVTEPLCHLIGIDPRKLTKKENVLLEVELFTGLCKALKEWFRAQHNDYFYLMKFNREKENDMLEANFITLIVRDILSTKEYTLAGIAYYTDTHQDVVDDVAAGLNKNPSATFQRRLIELHRSVRHDLYRAIMKKITIQLLTVG